MMRIDPNRGKGGSLRVLFSQRECTKKLERRFKTAEIPLAHLREIICQRAPLTSTQVKIWFQNKRRYKCKGSVRTRRLEMVGIVSETASRCRFWFGMESRA
ncbi:hypothetical protein cypCar_00001973 [Cyprinus carpio]|nr:hypothetical protein cypCar_00001973 [Cyprinus carpio]